MDIFSWICFFSIAKAVMDCWGGLFWSLSLMGRLQYRGSAYTSHMCIKPSILQVPNQQIKGWRKSVWYFSKLCNHMGPPDHDFWLVAMCFAIPCPNQSWPPNMVVGPIRPLNWLWTLACNHSPWLLAGKNVSILNILCNIGWLYSSGL